MKRQQQQGNFFYEPTDPTRAFMGMDDRFFQELVLGAIQSDQLNPQPQASTTVADPTINLQQYEGLLYSPIELLSQDIPVMNNQIPATNSSSTSGPFCSGMIATEGLSSNYLVNNPIMQTPNGLDSNVDQSSYSQIPSHSYTNPHTGVIQQNTTQVLNTSPGSFYCDYRAAEGPLTGCISPDDLSVTSALSYFGSSPCPSNLTENTISSPFHPNDSSISSQDGNVLRVHRLSTGTVDVDVCFPSPRSSNGNDREECPAITREGRYSIGQYKVVVRNPKLYYDKVQRRIGNESQQRIRSGVVNISITSTHPVRQVQALVRRDPKIADVVKDTNGLVILKSQIYQPTSCVIARCEFTVDLDEKYSIPTGDKTTLVYKLALNNTKEKNKFHLLLNLEFYGIPDKVENIFLYDFLVKSQVTECPAITREGRYSVGQYKVVVRNPKPYYDKVQKRIGNESQQRIRSGMVNISITSTHPVRQVQALVRRDPKIADAVKDTNGLVILKSVIYQPTNGDNEHYYEFIVELDEKYSIKKDGKTTFVYKLAQNSTKERNKFHLLLNLDFYGIPDKVENIFLYDFLVKSQVTGVAGAPSCKRPRLEDGREHDFESVREMAIDHLSAKVATFDKIEGLDFHTQTIDGDIGYYFRINNRFITRTLQEGDVIVFVEDENGATAIELLTDDNLNRAVLAGVITRRAYIKARRPGNWSEDDNILNPEHDIVCVIGMVPVKVKGEVQNGERIYTSEEEGTAVAESQLDGDGESQPIWLGFAMQSNANPESKLVDCFVSILLGMEDQKVEATTRMFRKKFVKRLDEVELVVQELEQSHRDLEENVNDIRRSNRGCKIKVCIALFVAIFIGVLGYIFLAPSSPYVKMRCREDSLKGTLSFDFKSGNADDEITISGLEFKWDILKKKLDLNFDEMGNGTDIRYFLNKYRCETGQILRVTS